MNYEFPAGFLKELLLEGELTDADGNLYVVLDKRITDTSRWSILYDMLFTNKTSDRLYIAHYSVGATEKQDERPWDCYDDEDMIEVQEAAYFMEPVWRNK